MGEYYTGIEDQFYLGTDGIDKPATTCQVCGGLAAPPMVAPCNGGTPWDPHRHVSCVVCWRAMHARALLHGGQGAIAWQN